MAKDNSKIYIRLSGSSGRNYNRLEKDIENVKKQLKDVFGKENHADFLSNYLRAAPLNNMNVTTMAAAIHIYHLYISQRENLQSGNLDEILPPSELEGIIKNDSNIKNYLKRYYYSKKTKSDDSGEKKASFILAIVRYLDYLIKILPFHESDISDLNDF